METTRTPAEMLLLIEELVYAPLPARLEPMPYEACPSYVITQPFHVLVSLLEKLISEDDISSMKLIAEFFRGFGYFYEKGAHSNRLLELLLRYAITLTEQSRIFTDVNVTWYLMTLYDLLFHQVKFYEYPENTRLLYSQLNLRITCPSLTPLGNSDLTNSHYSQCIYFTEMNPGH
jgi:hypothetical protein